MSDFKAKMHRIVCRLRLRPRLRGGSLQRSPRPHSWTLGGLLRRGGEGTRAEGRREERRVEKGRMGEGEGQGRPQAKAWPPELFSWRRRCGKRILDFLLVLTELRNIKQAHKSMHEVQTKYQYWRLFLNVLVCCFKQKKQVCKKNVCFKTITTNWTGNERKNLGLSLLTKIQSMSKSL